MPKPLIAMRPGVFLFARHGANGEGARSGFGGYTCTMRLTEQILEILKDGAHHSGVELGARLGVTRAAISKAVAEMAEIPVRVGRRGYRLPVTHRPLDAGRIRAIVDGYGAVLDDLQVLAEIDSTNRYLLQAAGAARTACLAERQTAGRGRRGRSWIADPYCNILLSVAVRIRGGSRNLGALSLAAGVAVHRALAESGITGVALKWPNDVLCAERKLAGILTEVRGEAEAPRVVIGVGLNCHLSAATGACIDQPWASLDEQRTVDRSALAGHLIAHLLRVVDEYERDGAAAVVAEWRTLHAYAGRAVTVAREDGVVEATLVDVTDEGALIVRVDGKEQIVYSGEARLRPL